MSDFCDTVATHIDKIRAASASLPDIETLDKLSGFFKVFGDVTRLKILSALAECELCVCDLAETLGMTVSAVSHQLAYLKQHELVAARRDGKTVFYSLKDEHVSTILAVGKAHIDE